MRRIIVPTDLSESAARAFPHAIELARREGASITLLYVVADITVAPHGAPFAPPLHAPDLADEADHAKAELEKLAGQFPDDVAVEVAVQVAPSVPRRIASFAAEQDADWIAISTHGRSGFRRMVLGSVTEAVLRHACTPVACFPPEDNHQHH